MSNYTSQGRDVRANALDKQAEKTKKSKVYTTEAINKILVDVRNGNDPDMNPFWHGQTEYRDAGIVFHYTDEELREYDRCQNDCIYFVKNYAKFLNDKGRTLVKLRDYQENILSLMSAEIYDEDLDDVVMENKQIILLQSRQTGKCVSMTQTCDVVEKENIVRDVPFYEIYYKCKKRLGVLDRLTRFVYRHNSCGMFDRLVFWLDHVKFGDGCDNKLIESFDADFEITTLDQFDGVMKSTRVTEIHRTRPYDEYELLLDNGKRLACADYHVVYACNLQDDEDFVGWRRVSDLQSGDMVMTDAGYSPVVCVKPTGRKQYMFDLTVDNQEHSYAANGILSHNTTTCSAYFTWFLLFHSDKNIVIVANKGDTAKEILGKIKDVISGLPFFLKPGIKNLSVSTVKFENGCSLKAKNTNKTSATGDSANIIYLDEAAHLPDSFAEEFWRSIKPTLSSFKSSQLIISSTPKGRGNLFERLYTGSINGLNSFKNFRVDWWQVPGHDQKWADQERIDFGAENFDQEYGLQFDITASMLLKARDINFMTHVRKKYESMEFYGIPKPISDKIIWHPNFHPDKLTYHDLMTRRFLLVIDTAQGKLAGAQGKQDSDYNIINIFEIEFLSPLKIEKNREGHKNITLKDCVQYRQVGLYMDNDFDEEQCAEAAKYITFTIFKSQFKDIDCVRILIEINFNGKNWINKFITHPNFSDVIILKTSHSQPVPGEKAKLQYGFRTSGGTHGKNYYCELGAKMIEKRQIIVSQYSDLPNMSSINQLQSFGKNNKGSYEGSNIHDDISVTILFVSRAQEIEAFMMWLEEWMEQLPKTKKLVIIANMLEKYMEQEPEVSDKDFHEFYSMASKNFGKLTKPIMSHSQTGFTESSGQAARQQILMPSQMSYSSLTKRAMVRNPYIRGGK